MASFQELANEILCNIFQYSNGKELAQYGMACRRFFDFTKMDNEWKLRCERDWNISQLPQNYTTWKDCYVDMYGRFGPYLTCYKRVSKCWDKIFAITRERCPAVYLSLHQEGTDEEALRSALKSESCGTKLPLEYRCTYRLCNGQTIQKNTSADGLCGGLFGAFYSSDYSNYMWSYRLGCPASIRRCCLTFIFISEYGSRLNGPLALCVRDERTTSARRSCQEDADHERLDCSVVFVKSNSRRCFIYANSFIGFLEDFADRITHYPVVNQRFLLFDFNAECDTGPFTVTVRTMFDRGMSTASPLQYLKFHFRHRITMRMRSDALQSDSCQLETHHWIITDANGKVEIEEGPGVATMALPDVIGDFPVTMRPGAEVTWTSATSYSTPTGKMIGYFKMRKFNTGREIRIDCPECHMVAPPFVPISPQADF